MTIVLFLSVLLKGVSAVVEILIQYLITKQLGVAGYGDYAFYINLIDIAFWIFFSGLVKCNTFYLSDQTARITSFKRKYYLRYVFPTIAVAFVAACLFQQGQIMAIPVVVILYLFMMDKSSERLARGKYLNSLIGEYLIGRAVLVLGVLLFMSAKQATVTLLVWLYGTQFIAVLGYFALTKKRGAQNVPARREVPVSVGKLWQYQQSDLASGLVSQSPVIMQYLFVGAYETGFTALVALVKKLVNFISGPTAKIFLPKFSELYRQGKITELARFYKTIMQIQMLFVGTIAVVLLGFSDLVLSFFAPELLEFSWIFKAISVAFLFVAGLGPGGGLLQMTGNEKTENRIRWITIGIMAVVCVTMRHDRLFALYGMCAQGIAEGILKYGYVWKWFGSSPMPVMQYGLLWLPAVAVSVLVNILRLERSIPALVLSAAIVFVAMVGVILLDKSARMAVGIYIKKMQNRRRQHDKGEFDEKE